MAFQLVREWKREERDSHSQQLCAINKSYAAAGETHKTFISLFTSRKLTHSKADEMVWLVQEDTLTRVGCLMEKNPGNMFHNMSTNGRKKSDYQVQWAAHLDKSRTFSLEVHG